MTHQISRLCGYLCMLTLFVVGSPDAGFHWFTGGWSHSTLSQAHFALEERQSSFESIQTVEGRSTGVLSISAADFRPSVRSYSFENHGRYLIHLDSSSEYGYYLAPVILPHGATVTRFSLAFRDYATHDLTATLCQDDSWGMQSEMAKVDSSGFYPDPHYGSKSDNIIQYATIDNSQYGYFVSLQMPESTTGDTDPVWFTGISIQFQYPITAANPEYYSMPAAGFNPYQDGYTFLNTGRFLYHNSGPGGETINNGWYWARAQLPQGATISSLTLFYSVNSTYAGYARLQRTMLGYGNFDPMATLIIPPGGPGDEDGTTTVISYPQVDNTQYAYWIVLDIPPLDRPNSTIIPLYATIGYTPPASSSTPAPVSIPAAAFTSYEDGYDFQNDARYLRHLHSPGGGSNNGWYLAPVQLPQGAKISKVQFYWHDPNSISSGIARLQRTDMVGGYDEMATLYSDGEFVSGFFGKTEDTSIDNPIVDNLYHTYSIVWDLPVVSTGDIRGCGMVIYYSYPLYLPVVRRAQ